MIATITMSTEAIMITIAGLTLWLYAIIYAWLHTTRIKAIIQLVAWSLIIGLAGFLSIATIVAFVHVETIKQYTITNIGAVVFSVCGCIALLLSLMLYEGKSRSKK